MELCNLEWKEFFLSEIFPEPKRGKRIVNDSHIAGNTPLVSSAGTNNGVTAFIGNTEKVRLYEKCLSIANGGSSAGRCFYEPFEFVASDHVTHCKNDELTENQYLALASLISGKLPEKYSFCREITDLRISREKIMLPVDKNGKPDFVYLEHYVEQIKEKLLSTYINHVGSKLKNMKCQEIPPLDEVMWKSFYLISDELFYIDKFKALDSTAEAKPVGKYDVIGATSKNNGSVGFIDNQDNLLVAGNCICLIKTGQGSVGDAVYKSNEFIPSNNIYIIRSEWLNEYVGNFIVGEINNQAGRYSYGYIRNDARVKKEIVYLPATTDGKPDYAYMEQYIKNIMIKKYKTYITYTEKVL